MASHEQYPPNDNVTEKQIPHSFRHGETPVREFDKTPLPDAVEQGLIVTPDSPALLMQEKKSRGWKKASAAGALVLVTAAGAFGIGTAKGGNDTIAKPRVEPSVSASANPGEVTPSSPVENEAITLDMKDFGQNGELFAAAFYEMENEWYNSGITPEIAKSDERFAMSDEEFVAKINAPLDEQFISKYFVSDWQSNPNLVKYIESIVSIHRANSSLALVTSNPEYDPEQYRREINLESSEIVSELDGELVVSTRWSESDNQDKNRAGQYISGSDPNTLAGGGTITSIETGDGRKISDVTYYAG